MLWNKKESKKKIAWQWFFYLENRTVKCEELEVTEENTLGYDVTAEKRKSNDKRATVEAISIVMDIASLALGLHPDQKNTLRPCKRLLSITEQTQGKMDSEEVI